MQIHTNMARKVGQIAAEVQRCGVGDCVLRALADAGNFKFTKGN